MKTMPPCPKCGGRLFLKRDLGRAVTASCINCGYLKEYLAPAAGGAAVSTVPESIPVQDRRPLAEKLPLVLQLLREGKGIAIVSEQAHVAMSTARKVRDRYGIKPVMDRRYPHKS